METLEPLRKHIDLGEPAISVTGLEPEMWSGESCLEFIKLPETLPVGFPAVHTLLGFHLWNVSFLCRHGCATLKGSLRKRLKGDRTSSAVTGLSRSMGRGQLLRGEAYTGDEDHT